MPDATLVKEDTRLPPLRVMIHRLQLGETNATRREARKQVAGRADNLASRKRLVGNASGVVCPEMSLAVTALLLQPVLPQRQEHSHPDRESLSHEFPKSDSSAVTERPRRN